MKILFIGPLPEPVTGQSLACQVLLDALRAQHEVDVINLSKSGLSNGADSARRILEVGAILWRVLRRRWGAELIYFTVAESRAGNAKDLLIFAACAGRLGHVLLHLHGGAGMRALLLEQTGLQRRLNEWLLPRVGGVVVLGPRLVSIYANTIRPARIHVVPNFAPDAIFLPSVDIQRKFLATEPLRVLYLSNLLPGKGYLELLGALTQLPTAELDRLRIDFAGGFESTSAELAFRAAIAPFKQIRYHGVVHGAEKVRLFHEAHVFCLPTYYAFEGQPISILEAYAAGCAVVTTDHSGIRDVFTPEENGYEVVPRSEASIAHALQRALRDPQKLSAIALHNQATATSNYRAESFCARLLDLFSDLGDRRRITLRKNLP